MRYAWLGALLLGPTLARAEGTGPQGPSDADRLRGAIELASFGNALVGLGGSKLRYLAPGGAAWRELYEHEGELSEVAIDARRGRVLAAWYRDPTLRYLSLGARRPATLRLPEPKVPQTDGYLINRVFFAANGREALVFVNGNAGRNDGIVVNGAFRVPLDGAAPTLLFDAGKGLLLAASPRGAVYLLPHLPEAACTEQGCDAGRVVAYTITAAGALATTILDDAELEFSYATVVPGSNDERLVLDVSGSHLEQTFLLYPWGGTAAGITRPPRPKVAGWCELLRVSPSSDELLYLFEDAKRFEVWREPLRRDKAAAEAPPPPPSGPQELLMALTGGIGGRQHIGRLTLGPAPPVRLPVHGRGLRADGSLWLHRGDDLVLIATDGTARVADLRRIVGGTPEWAETATYVEKPESLWIGVEIGAGRDFVRVPFATLEKQAQPWPRASPN